MFQNHPRAVAKIAVAGCGGRGNSMLSLLLEMEDVRITAVCDPNEERAKYAAGLVEKAYGASCAVYTDHREMMEKDDADGVMVSCSWQAHCEVAIAAMRAGKYAAIECGGGCSLDELWDLVRTSETTGVPCMALENCCYDRNEMAILNMIKQNVFGEVVHVQGGYGHDLRDEVSFGRENYHYRFNHYKHRNGELYPGHAIGPMAKYLNINRGNRMVSLVSMSSKARGLNEFLKREKGDDYDMTGYPWAEGDIVTTMIRCSGGETMLLTHDTTLPRYYSRFGSVRGTRGMWMEDGSKIFLDGSSDDPSYAHAPQDFAPYYEKYKHPLWKQFEQEGVKGGHGGMDWLVLRAWVESMLAGTVCPTDVYDAAAWMAVTVLSEQSIAQGSSVVAFPDFTNGKWLTRDPWLRTRYCLDEVCTDLFEEEEGSAE